MRASKHWTKRQTTFFLHLRSTSIREDDIGLVIDERKDESDQITVHNPR